MNLDLKDKKLIYELGLNSRQPVRELAKKLNLSKSTVNYRINRLVKNNIISGFKTYVNSSRLGSASFALYLKFQNQDKETEKQIINYFLSSKNVSWVGTSYGNWELIVEFISKDFQVLSSFLSEFYELYSSHIQKKELVQYISEDFFGYKLINRKEHRSLHVEFVGEKAEIDEIDEAIITYVTDNPNYNLYKIALDLKLSLDVVSYRIKKLIKHKVIAGYSIQLDFGSLGLGWYIFQLSLNNYSDEKKFISFLQKHPNVFYAIKYIGKWSYELGLYIKNSEELEKLILELKSEFPEMIKDYEFSLVTKLYRFK